MLDGFFSAPSLPLQAKLAEVSSKLGILERDCKKLLEEKNRLLVVLSAITDGVVMVDMDSKIIFLNQTALDLMGFKEEEVLAKNIQEVFRLFDKTVELTFLHFCPLREPSFKGKIFQKKPLKLVGKKELFIDLSTVQVSTPPCCILIFHDASKETQLESLKVDFISMAAHELRTPLTSIKGYLSVFMNENGSKLDSEQKSLLEQAVAGTNQLNDLVENLLNVSRIDRGVAQLNLEVLDWNFFVEQTAGPFKQRIVEKGIEFEFEGAGVDLRPQVRADKVRMAEVLANLLSNALKFTDPGGKIKISVATKDNQIVTSVSDTGKGIAQEALPRLFSKFYRATSILTAADVKGTGLGLYIAKSIVEMHHGKIWVQSQLGKGSTFSFSLSL